MQPNETKAKLKVGETVFGCFIRYPDAGLVEFVGYQGWDFLIFDGEHSPLETRDCQHMVRAAEISGVTPIVRVPSHEEHVLLRFMDTGAQGAQVPNVNSAADAEAVVQAVKYQPRGQRGLAGVRAAAYGQRSSLAEYIERANAETMVVVHIETVAAVEQISEIVAVEDIDAIFIGPMDLSHSLGHVGNPQHPDVRAAIDKVVEAVRTAPSALVGHLARTSP